MLDSPGRSSPDRHTASFPRRLRLLRPAEFECVFRDACRINGRHLVVLARPNGLEHPRLGLAIAKKHAKLAVSRNRIKRQVRETFRRHQDEIGGFDVVVLARPGIDRLDRAELRSVLQKHWRALPERCKRSSSP